MRTLTATERGYVSDPAGHWQFSFLEVTNADGTWVNTGDLTAGGDVGLDFLNSCSFSDGIDSNTISFHAEMVREIGLNDSLSPFRADSLVNVDDSDAFAPLLDLHREWRIKAAIMPRGTYPDVSDYREMAHGIVDTIDIAEMITVDGRGLEADILDAFVVQDAALPGRTALGDRPYSGDQEDVIQDALDEQMGVGVVALSVPGGPTAFAVADEIGDINLQPALSDIAALDGKTLRYRYDALDVNRYTLFTPPRTATVPDWTIGGDEILHRNVSLDLSGVRNYIKVRYQDATSGVQTVISPGAESGTVSCSGGSATFTVSQAGVLANGALIVVEDVGYRVTSFNGTTGCTLADASNFSGKQFYTSASLTKYGLRVFPMDLASGTQITTSTAAGNLANAVRSDREDPAIVQSFEAPGLWFVQLCDYVCTTANNKHYTEDQFGGVTSYTQNFANGMLRTTVNLSGKPKGRYATWKRIGSGTSAVPTVPSLTWLYSVESDGGTGQQANIAVTVLNSGPEFVNLTARTQLGNLYYHTDVTGATRQFVPSGTVIDETDTFSDGITVTTFLGPIAIIPGGVPWLDLQAESQSGKLSLVQRVPILIAAAPTDTATVQWDLSVPGQLKADVLSAPGAPPTGAAGGSLAGSFPNPTIASGVSLPGSPTTTTQSAGDNSTKVATTAYVDSGLALKAALASPTFTGDPKAPTPSPGDNDTSIATTAFVTAAVAAGGGGGAVSSVFGRTGAVVATAGDYAVADITGAAPLASPALTGTPTAPTASPGDNDTSIATTAFVTAALVAGGYGGSTPLGTVWDGLIPDSSPHADTDEFTSSSTISNWTGIYTGDASVVNDIATTQGRGMYFEAPSVLYRIRSRMKTIPVGDFTVHAAVILNARPAGASTIIGCGIMLADGTTPNAGKQTGVIVARSTGFGSGALSTGRLLWANYGNDATSATYDTFDWAHSLSFIRLRRVGATYYRAVSPDGENWAEITFTLLAGLTPTHYGLGFQNYGAAGTCSATVLFFRTYATGTQYKTGAMRTFYG